MDLYESLCTSFATAGTGGFSVWSDGMMTYGGVTHPEYCTWTIAIFMLLFSINFNLYFLLITGKIASAIFSEELWWFIGIVATATALTTWNVYSIYHNFSDSLRHAFFQVSSVISTSGFATTDFNLWPNLSKTVLLIIMFIGACAGSTGGGIKVSRIVIAAKSAFAEIVHMVRPRQVQKVRFEKKAVDSETIKGIYAYAIVYAFIFFASFLIIAICDGQTIETTVSSVSACLNNIGPALGEAGPVSNYAFYSAVSKIVLSFDMLLGRLEIFPIIMLFSPSVWRGK